MLTPVVTEKEGVFFWTVFDFLENMMEMILDRCALFVVVIFSINKKHLLKLEKSTLLF